MAASREEKVTEFLTCVICQELYTDPCTLRCDHTFCRKCVTSYIQTRPDTAQSKTIPCPCCRQDTKVPHPSRPVEEWAGQIKPSIIIQGLIDTQEPSASTAGTASCCSLCEKLGETTPGALWCSECEVLLCERCVKMHRASPASHDHEMCDPPGQKVKRRRKVVCQEHKGEVIKFVCKDCRKAACQTCCVIYHRKCECVVTMESLMPTMKYHLKKNVKVLSRKINRKQNLVQETQKKISGIEETKVYIECHIKCAVERVIANIRQKEKQLMNEVKNITDKQRQQLKADIKLQECEMQMYRQHCEFIDQALVSDCEMDLYDAYQAWESGGVEMEDVRDTEAAGTRRIDDIRFTPHTDIVVDYNNKCVKSIFTRNNQPCHSKLPLDNRPKGITQLNEKQVMVAVPHSRQIVTVEVTPDLVLLSTITTRTCYYSLAVLNPSSMAAGAWDTVDILDMGGHVLRSITTYNDDSRFTLPWYMCVNDKGNLLVCDWRKESVTCLTPEGDVVWRFAPTGDRALRYPRGITTNSRGDTLLVDSGKVIQLTESGEFARDYQNIVGNPRGLYVDRHDTMYACGLTQIREFHFT